LGCAPVARQSSPLTSVSGDVQRIEDADMAPCKAFPNPFPNASAQGKTQKPEKEEPAD
jgi:hypothetical protein